MTHANLDFDRKDRTGFPEVVFCQGKPDEYLVDIYKNIYEREGQVFGTRATEHQYDIVKAILEDASYDKISRILKVVPKDAPKQELIGNIAVVTAGTADIPVAEEAAQTAEYFGSKVTRVFDVGVSGIHRVLSNVDVLNEANCVVAVAGMEGALASVVGGLVKVPVIAVPTSVGYGASLDGGPASQRTIFSSFFILMKT